MSATIVSTERGRAASLFGSLAALRRRPAGVEAVSPSRTGAGGALKGAAPRPGIGPDRLLCAVVLLLVAAGVVMVFSAGAAFAARTYGDYAYFLKREGIYATLGLCAFTFALRTDYGVWRRWTYPLLLVTVTALALVLVFGTSAKGAHRWFRFGPLSLQPSELSKLALVLYLSVLLARRAAAQVRTFSVGFLPPLVVTGALAGLVVVEPDLGTAVILGATAVLMMFVAGTRTTYLLGLVLIAAPVAWHKLILGKAFRLRRVIAFLDPWQYCRDEGFQLCESLISLGSGGATGVGLGESRQKLFFLPEAHTDFILAVLGEELGLVGVLAMLALFGLLIWRGLAAALRARDLFGSYLAFGITAVFGTQALFNMGVVLGLLPTKGLVLPFVSYGGTSLIVSLFMAGILGNISARNPEPRPESLKRRGLAGSRNKRAERAPRVVVEVGRPRPQRQTSSGAAADTVLGHAGTAAEGVTAAGGLGAMGAAPVTAAGDTTISGDSCES